MSEVLEEQTLSKSGNAVPRPRYLRAAVILWVFFALLKIFDDYDGIVSFIGAPIVATFLTVITMVPVVLMGLLLRWSRVRSWWYATRRPAAVMLTLGLLVLIFGESLGITETYFDKDLEVTRQRLHQGASAPSF